MPQRHALGRQCIDQIEQAVQGVQVRGRGRDLRADVAINAHHRQAGQVARQPVGGQGFFMGHTELVVLQAGGDVRMGAGVPRRG